MWFQVVSSTLNEFKRGTSSNCAYLMNSTKWTLQPAPWHKLYSVDLR